jgi:UDP-N-acetylmuramyl pentapeptide synthase
MGMSEAGEIERLTQIAAPDVAIVTKIALAHAMNFPDGLAGIARAKAEIFSKYPKTRTAIVDLEFMEYREIIDTIRAEKITFSIKDRSADYYLSFTDGQFRIDERGVRAHRFDLPFTESHHLHDFTAAVAAARQFGMAWEEIEKQIPKLSLPKMRFELFELGGMRLINDAYNANPASMRAALENMPEASEGGKKIAVLGSMKELGSFCDEAHDEIGRLAQKHVDLLLCIGEETLPLCDAFGEAKKPFEHFSDRLSLSERLKEIMRPGDVVLFKGSRSMQLEKIVESLHAASIS